MIDELANLAPGTRVLINTAAGPLLALWVRTADRRWGFAHRVRVAVVEVAEDACGFTAGSRIDVAPHMVLVPAAA
jgi:hypothetical protein